jgi:hypothetical protein
MPRLSFERRVELESALTDAKHAADIVSEWMGQAIGFENATPPRLSAADCTNIYWAMNTVAHLISEADRIFHEPEPKGDQ